MVTLNCIPQAQIFSATHHCVSQRVVFAVTFVCDDYVWVGFIARVVHTGIHDTQKQIPDSKTNMRKS